MIASFELNFRYYRKQSTLKHLFLLHAKKKNEPHEGAV